MPKKPDGLELLSKIMGRYINVVKGKNSGQNRRVWVCTFSFYPNIPPKNRIELERQHLKKDELSSQIFEDELDQAYAVIYGVQARGERGNYSTQRVKFNSERTG